MIAVDTNILVRYYAQDDRDQAALYMSRAGLEFPDALHLAAAAHCSRFLTFDDRRFSRRARRLKLKPPVSVPED